MFWRKTREAIGRFHPLHQGLVWDRRLSASMAPAEWGRLLESLSRHESVVRRRKWRLPPALPVVVGLVRVLTEDVAPDAVLGVTADLRGPKAPGKAGPSREVPVQRPIRKLIEWFVLDPWLRVRAELRDGSVLELAVTDRVRYRRITKRTPRGKIKTKTKTKTVRRIAAVRTLPKGQGVQRPAGPPPWWIGVRLRDDKRAVIRATAKVTPERDPTRHVQVDPTQQILTVATEVFRWTPPRRPQAPRRRTA